MSSDSSAFGTVIIDLFVNLTLPFLLIISLMSSSGAMYDSSVTIGAASYLGCSSKARASWRDRNVSWVPVGEAIDGRDTFAEELAFLACETKLLELGCVISSLACALIERLPSLRFFRCFSSFKR